MGHKRSAACCASRSRHVRGGNAHRGRGGAAAVVRGVCRLIVEKVVRVGIRLQVAVEEQQCVSSRQVSHR